jgi:flagellar basal body-associated protein FliL
MATQAIEEVPPDEAVAAPAKPKSRVMIMAAAGILAGAAAGLFGVGPVLASRRSGATRAPKAAEAMTAAVTHKVENLVLNPAGSEGHRFLMVTATFELKDAATDQLFKEHEDEIRDHILALLGKMTVEELSDISQRDRIKAVVLASVSPLFPKGSLTKVFFPQFVIQ